MKPLISITLICLLLVSCKEVVTALPLPVSTVTQTPSATPKHLATNTPPTLLIPEPPPGFPTPQVPHWGKMTFFQEAITLPEFYIGKYVIRNWSNRDPALYFFGRTYTISTTDQPQVQIDLVFGLNPLSGTDITGEGIPDVIFETDSGGNESNYGEVVYELGPTLREVMNLQRLD